MTIRQFISSIEGVLVANISLARLRSHSHDVKFACWLCILAVSLWTLTGCGGGSDTADGAGSGGTDVAATGGGGGSDHGSDEGDEYNGDEENGDEDENGDEHGGGSKMADTRRDPGYEDDEEYDGGDDNDMSEYNGAPSTRGSRMRQPIAPSRSDNVGMWTEDDFKTAAAERDPRVVAALQAYATAPTPDDDKVALWTAMLESLAAGPAAATAQPANQYGQQYGSQPGMNGSGGSAQGAKGSFAGGDEHGSDGGMSEGSSTRNNAQAPSSSSGGGDEHGSGGGGMSAPTKAGSSSKDDGEHDSGAAITTPIGHNIASVEMLLLFSAIGQNPAGVSTRARLEEGSEHGSGGDSMEDEEDYENNFGGNGNAGQNRHPATETTAIAEAIIQHLIANGSEKAEATIIGILRGETPTGLEESESIALVLKVLLTNSTGADSKSQKLLSRILTEPDAIRPADPATLQSAAVTMMAGLAASAVDTMFGLNEPAADQPRGGRPGRRGGVPGYGDDEYDGGESEYGQPGSGSRPGGAGSMKLEMTAMSPEQLNKVVTLLWTPAFTGQIADRVRSTPLNEDTQIFALAGAIPSTTIRKAQYESMQANIKQGANSLLSMGLFDGVARDPGLLVVLKSLPRPRASSSSSSRRSTGGDNDDVANSWLSATGHMVNTLKERLHKAAMISGKTQLDGSPMVRMHSGASAPTAVFELDWPKDARSIVASANPSPMKIHYVRINETIGDRALRKVLDHYRSKTRGTKREIPNGVWFEGSLKSTSTGARLSSDVVITKSNGGGGGGEYGDSDGGGGAIGSGYTIEVIAIQVPDPKPATKTALK